MVKSAELFDLSYEIHTIRQILPLLTFMEDRVDKSLRDFLFYQLLKIYFFFLENQEKGEEISSFQKKFYIFHFSYSKNWNPYSNMKNEIYRKIFGKFFEILNRVPNPPFVYVFLQRYVKKRTRKSESFQIHFLFIKNGLDIRTVIYFSEISCLYTDLIACV